MRHKTIEVLKKIRDTPRTNHEVLVTQLADLCPYFRVSVRMSRGKCPSIPLVQVANKLYNVQLSCHRSEHC
jgi:hypothetical protein